MDTITNIAVERVPIDSVQPHPRNARRGDLDIIAESLQVHGQYAPIVVQAASGNVIKGNHTWAAAKQIGWDHIDIVRVDVDDDQAIRILLVDNRSSDVGSYEEQSLTDLLAGLNGDLSGTGYDDGDLDARLAELTPTDDQGRSASEMLNDWENKDARTILLTYTVAEHGAMCDKLDALAERFDVDTYSRVVERLVAEATE